MNFLLHKKGRAALTPALPFHILYLFRLRGQHHAQLLEGLLIGCTQHTGGVDLAAAEIRELPEGKVGQRVALGAG